MKYTAWYLVIIICALGCKSEDQSYPLVEAPSANSEFYSSGLAAIEQRVKASPSNADAHYKRAIYLQASGAVPEAIGAISQAISLDPTPEYLMKQAELFKLTDNYEAALNSISRAQLLGGDYPELWHLMADLNLQQGNLRQALNQVNTALQKHPQGSNYYLAKGKIQWALNDTLSAVRSLMIAKDHPEVRYPALNLLVDLHQSRGKYDEAFKYLRQNQQDQNGDLSLNFKEAQLFREIEKYDSALLILQNLQRYDTSDFRLYHESSEVYWHMRWYDSALHHSERASALKNDFLPALLTQARVHDRKRFYSKSREIYESIIAIDSTFVPAKEELEKLNGKIAYLQLIRNRERNAGVKLLTPKPTNQDN